MKCTYIETLIMLSIYSFLQPQEPISTTAEEADKVSVIIGTNKSFENSQPYFTRDGKMGDMYLVILW